MIKTEKEFGCIVESVSEIKETGAHKYIEMILRKPARKDEFQQIVGKDDVFRAVAWNKMTESVPEGLQKGDKVMVGLSFAGHEGTDNQGKKYYSINVGIWSIRRYEGKK